MAPTALNAHLETLRHASCHRTRPEISARQGKWIELDGTRLLNFASNDYLGLAACPQWHATVAQCFATHAPCASASPLAGGHSSVVQKAEQTLATYFGYDEALLMPSGYQANIAVLWVMSMAHGRILYDKRIHASTAMAIRGSSAIPHGFIHNDMSALERRLRHIVYKHTHCTGDAVFVESLYSMDGDSPNFSALGKLKERYGYTLVVDEAHALGVLGPGGRGLGAGTADIAVGTLGKALGLFGAFILLPKGWSEFFQNLASPFIHSTALPDAHAACVTYLPKQLASMDTQRAHLAAMSSLLHEKLHHAGLPTQGREHIVVVPIGAEQRATAVAEALRHQSIFALAARPPTTPRGKSVVRLGVTALHTPHDIEICAQALIRSIRSIP